MAVERETGPDATGAIEQEPGSEAGPGTAPGAQRYRDAITQLAIEWIKSIVIAFILFMFIRTFLIEAYRIPSGSMEKSLLVGDFLLVNKAVYGAHLPFTRKDLPSFAEPKRGDIVVFVPPHVQNQNYVKRLIGVAGDTVEMRAKTLYVNGAAQREPYAQYRTDPDSWAPSMQWQCEHRPEEVGTQDCRPSRDNWGPLVVPADRFLMLGDNRDDSEDSRYWGFVDRGSIKGRPLVVYYSFEPSADRRMPYFSAIRWSRIGSRPQ